MAMRNVVVVEDAVFKTTMIIIIKFTTIIICIINKFLIILPYIKYKGQKIQIDKLYKIIIKTHCFLLAKTLKDYKLILL